MMKKRILLTIMILFSIKVNSNDNCKLPDIKFFEMVEEGDTSKFSFKPFIDKVTTDFAGSIGGQTEILGVKFDKKLALGALYDIYNLFVTKLAERGSNSPHPFPQFIKDYEAEEARLMSLKSSLEEASTDFEDAIANFEGVSVRAQINAKVKGNDEAVPYTKGIVDYLVSTSAKETKWFGLREIQVVTDPKPIDTEALNASLSYIYLFALSFLIKNDKDSEKFLRCMFDIYINDLAAMFNKIKRPDIQILFDQIERETGMRTGKLKPEPLSLEQSRSSLNTLSSTLNSLANLKLS